MTPLMSAESTSSSTRGAWTCRRKSSRKRSRSRLEALGVGNEVTEPQLALVFEQQVVHLPERPLGRRRLRRLGGSLGVRVDIGERQVPPDVADVAEVRQQLAHDRLGFAAVGALEVPVLDDGHRRLGRPAQVIPLGIHRHGQVGERLRAAQQGTDARPSGEHGGGPKDQPGQGRSADGCAQHAELRLPQLDSVKGQRRDQQGDGEADSRDRPSADGGGPTDRRAKPSPAQPRHQPGGSAHPDRLAEDVGEENPNRDRRRIRP